MGFIFKAEGRTRFKTANAAGCSKKVSSKAGFDAKQKKQLKVFPQIKYPFMKQNVPNGKRWEKVKIPVWATFWKAVFRFSLSMNYKSISLWGGSTEAMKVHFPQIAGNTFQSSTSLHREVNRKGSRCLHQACLGGQVCLTKGGGRLPPRSSAPSHATVQPQHWVPFSSREHDFRLGFPALKPTHNLVLSHLMDFKQPGSLLVPNAYVFPNAFSLN